MTEGQENRGKLLDELEQVRRRSAELEACLRKGDRGCNVADDRGSASSTVPDLDSPPPPDSREDSAVEDLNRLPDADVLFEHVPIPLWYHDYSLVEKYLDDLKDKGINDFQEYFRAHPSALDQCEEKLRLIDVNSSALELFKASSKQVFFDNYKKLFLEEAIETFREDIAGLAAGRCSNLHEIQMRTLEGDEIFVLFGWAVLPDSKSHSSQVLYSVIDITDRKRAQQQLEKSEAELSDLASMVNSAILRWKPGGEISYFNRFAEDFFGYRAYEVLGKTVTMLIPDAESSGKSLATLVEDIVSHPDRYRTNVNENVLKNGDRVWMVWTNKAVFDEQGRLVEILAVGNDITVQKNDENKLRRSHHELERLVQERTAELADMNSVLTEEIEERKALERALYEKAAELARSNRELEQFAYVASHDLQEPLRNVTNCIHLLRERNWEKLGPDADQLMTYAENSAGRMKELINDLLRYSRIQARGKPFRAVDCREALGASLENLRTVIKESDAVVTCDALPTVQGDRTQLMQVFQNLIANSIKFRGDKPPRIHVSAKEDDGDWVFSVADNGIGIAQEYVDLIFTPFKRLHSKDSYPGSGIGLSVAKKIIERHRGEIWVESQLGAGATFFFTIPLGEEEES